MKPTLTRERKVQLQADRLDLCRVLPSVQERLFRCGLYETAHAMDAAVKAIGYEVAGKRTTPTPEGET